jgi:cytochrome c biogenesis protein CcdA
MESLLTTGSILAAFFAGAVALFSPCCIVFLFPAYFASAVKNRRWALLPLTFVFALGLAVVLLPVTLGITLMMSGVRKYHAVLYAAGGGLMIALAVLSLLGKSWSMPSFVRTPSIERGDTASVFALGVFSGVASSCCAPVMAGVMALSALSGSLVGASGLGLAYVFGMVFPLFVMAVLWDRLRLGERRLFTAKPVALRLAGKIVHTNTVNIGVAVAFALMGGFVLYLAATGNTTEAPPFQLAIGGWLADASGRIVDLVDPIPEPILGLGLLALAASFFVVAARDRARPTQGGPSDDDQDEDQPQEQATPPATSAESGRDPAALSSHGGSCHDAAPREGAEAEVEAPA